MSLACFGRATVVAGWLVLSGVSGLVVAGESLPPLRVDPTLLGGAPLKPAPAPAKPVAVPETPAESAGSAAPVSAIKPPGPAPVPPRPGVEVTPVAAPPAARELGTAPPVASQTPAAVPIAATVTAAKAPPAVPVPPVTAAPARTAQNLPPLRVDPALLGGTALARQGIKPEVAEPPLVAEQPALPPLYSAYLAAGRFAHPSTTPMSHVDKSTAPTIVIANRISGVNDVEMIAEGNAEMIRAGDALRGDRIIYRVADDEVESIGSVVLSSPDTEIKGPRMRMRMEESTGEFEAPAYAIKKEQKPIKEAALTMSGLPAADAKGNALVWTGRMITPPPVTSSGTADRLEFRGQDMYHLENTTYSTCAPGKRDWEMRIDQLDLDYNSERGDGRNAVLRFMDVPLFYTPWMNFSLNADRKSGFLPGTFGSTNKSGIDVTAPWYWNIAPNMDATITPRYMSKRGLQVNSEFRYLLNTDNNQNTSKANPALSGSGLPDKGTVRVEYLPGDKLADRDRYGYSILHNQTFLPSGFLSGHTIVTNLNLNGVSDDNYYSDLSTRIASISQGNLLRQGVVTLGGPWYSASLNVQTFQTLQNLSVPYRRLPQLTATANRYDLPLGMAMNFNAEYVNFDHPTELLGRRTTLYPQLSLPLATSAFNLTPKIGIHYTTYDLSGQERLAATDYRRNMPNQESRAVPIFSVDSSVVFERDVQWFDDRAMVQTLEPRAYYVYIPKHDQSRIPVFDSGLMGFNYAQMFTENRYAGNDRIGDANQLTLALTSRMLDPSSGAELLRATIGARQYFTQQDINASLPGESIRTSRSTDILAAFTGQVLPKIYADVGWQFNPAESKTQRFTLGGRYRPSEGRIFNAGYRYDRDNLDQIDVSAQWPLFGGWNGVGRYNYSLKEKRVIETIGGLEYNAGCWMGRFVLQRLATIADKPTTAVFFQLELNDFSKIGSNPMELLRRNIPGYGIINQPTADPVFAGN